MHATTKNVHFFTSTQKVRLKIAHGMIVAFVGMARIADTDTFVAFYGKPISLL